jgi:hypothetical protein
MHGDVTDTEGDLPNLQFTSAERAVRMQGRYHLSGFHNIAVGRGVHGDRVSFGIHRLPDLFASEAVFKRIRFLEGLKLSSFPVFLEKRFRNRWIEDDA